MPQGGQETRRGRTTLCFGPLWVLSAITGHTRFDDDEKAAFWDSVTEAAVQSPGAGRAALGHLAAERRWIFDEFELDDRSVVTGILAVTSLLAGMTAEDRDDVRRAFLGLGRSFARARGPFGRRIMPQDEQVLLLLEQLLQTSPETAESNPLNAATPI